MIGSGASFTPSSTPLGNEHRPTSDASYDHSNLLGRYTFVLAEPLARGALRPLRDPTVPDAVAQ